MALLAGEWVCLKERDSMAGAAWESKAAIPATPALGRGVAGKAQGSGKRMWRDNRRWVLLAPAPPPQNTSSSPCQLPGVSELEWGGAFASSRDSKLP